MNKENPKRKHKCCNITRTERNTKNQKKRKDEINNKEDTREIQKILEEIQKILEEIEEIQDCKNDSNRMYEAKTKCSTLNNPKEQIGTVVETDNGITTNEDQSMEIVTDWFEKALYRWLLDGSRLCGITY